MPAKRRAHRPKRAPKQRNPSPKQYEVFAGAAGVVYVGTDGVTAARVYREYVVASRAGTGPAAGESVALMLNGDVIRDFQGKHDR